MVKGRFIPVNEHNMPLGDTRRNARWPQAIVNHVRALSRTWHHGEAGMGCQRVGYRRLSKQLGIPLSTIAHWCTGRTRDLRYGEFRKVIDNEEGERVS